MSAGLDATTLGCLAAEDGGQSSPPKNHRRHDTRAAPQHRGKRDETSPACRNGDIRPAGVFGGRDKPCGTPTANFCGNGAWRPTTDRLGNTVDREGASIGGKHQH